ncbi:bifunctional pantoate--beta-alanine ligase/(d)CMP kinase [Synechococcus elongatus]|uniref:Bifunctional pantoate ligase/cytidylate kinase n=2 Tax=Synechococcus elongatus TaxID=32046 RepID=PANCY_SYNE7|nr:bifunctional pantoate--beta-alanine ligase/(d)CMP kinase [Synechococcus elongatus]Q31P38.1 RecName: Full=Bifunctional pantoate ligase/cytidylate kinase; Includes: RecName: Full=Pantothenate synthetase; Short=PS; AltName: Full=Pantoate--beta-alanine ligase; AltName: Full=Pantoate-activating enzyme; Includes: RecName: Full=Cytidylate kinase; Short=CK; AltName: Full=Cytidine monophosphate kinase; Short=CMP kinase [Synechococcus elongatus PCC 7942 = FACHB-805]Q5N530.1 RecName: Full=Bifunctional pa
MRQLISPEALRAFRQSVQGSVGFVPTMGALHAGHRSLIERSRQQDDVVIVSIFVNPRQFGPQEDLSRYPQTLDADLALCEAAGVDAVFCPTAEALYPRPSDRSTGVQPPAELIQSLCGRQRPGHFQGVATVVLKLLQLVQPQRAYFGEKDAQQLRVIQRLVEDFNLPIAIVPCPTVREPDGLALSSRNRYLTFEERSQASGLYRALRAAAECFQAGSRDSQELVAAATAVLATTPAVQLEYCDCVDADSLQPLTQIPDRALLAIAARVGTARLIDNLTLQGRRPIIAIDGPAGAGKSTVTKRLAQQLGLLYLDTGAMYRAVTWLVQQQGIDPQDPIVLAELLAQADLQLRSQPAADGSEQLQVLIQGNDVTAAIRTPTVTAQVSAIAALPLVRQFLVEQQRQLGQRGGLVAEGRDIGTHVFPDAELKIFLTATNAERARRRALDLEAQGLTVDLAQLEAEIRDRDRQDSERAIAPLCKAEDAVEVLTDGLSIEAVTDQIIRLYRDRGLGDSSPQATPGQTPSPLSLG